MRNHTTLRQTVHFLQHGRFAGHTRSRTAVLTDTASR
jgi:hypothetical protein